MSEVTRTELEAVHGRISDLKERVVVLEAQQPHINAALVRIEHSVDRLNGHLTKLIWLCVALFVAAVGKFVLSGGLHLP